MTNSAQGSLILLVDDDADFLEIHRRILESHGYLVQTCSQPQEAISHLEQHVPDLIITDLMMQDLDSGFTLARHIRQHAKWRNIPIIMITAISSERGISFTPHSDQELAGLGTDAFFDKPVNAESLLSKVAQLLARREGRDN